jgi:hypothetical protein
MSVPSINWNGLQPQINKNKTIQGTGIVVEFHQKLL